MAKDIYFHFRRIGTADGLCISLPIFDLSKTNALRPDADVTLRVDGKVVATPRPHEEASYPAMVRAGNILPALYMETPIHEFAEHLKRGITRLECVGPDGNPLSESAVFALPGTDDYPVPDEENMVRVAGKIKANGFLVSGACWYTSLQKLLETEMGGIAKDDAVLDWGVGCGRVARYFLLDGYSNFHGIDIDQKNIDWCNDNLPGATFSRCDFDPPTRYEDEAFKVIYGHSVFTHLDEASEIAWLKEISRLLSSDGIACCTIGSEVTCQMIYNGVFDKHPDFLKTLHSTGRQDFGADKVGVDEGRDGYYRLVSHTRDYIYDRWSEYVDIKRIIPGFALNQDAVIFSKKR